MASKSFSFSKMEKGEDFPFPPSLPHEEIKKRLLESKSEIKAASKEVFAILESEHKASSALELKNKLVALDKYMTCFSDFLDERLDETENSEKEKTLKSFRNTCNQLTSRVDKMNRMINDDVFICQQKEGRDTKDAIKIVTYVVGLPTLAANFAKIFFDEKSALIQYIAVGSIIIGTWLAFPKETQKAWNNAKIAVNNKKSSVQNSFILYYARTRRQEITRKARVMAKKLIYKNKL